MKGLGFAVLSVTVVALAVGFGSRLPGGVQAAAPVQRLPATGAVAAVDEGSHRAPGPPGVVAFDESRQPATPGAVYFYDFEQGAAGWALEPNVWTWTTFEKGHALRGDGHGFVRLTAHSGDVSRLLFRFRLETLRSSLNANVLDNIENNGGRYLVHFESGGVHISRQSGGASHDFGQGFVSITPGVWHTADIRVGGGSVDVFLDGMGAVGIDDPSPPAGGTVSFESLENSLIYVDDVEVRIGAETTPHPHAPRPPLSLPPGPDVGPFVKGIHTGTITLTGTTVLTLSQGRYTVRAGNIELRDNAVLRVEPNAVLVFDRGDSPLIHWGPGLLNSARLEVNGGNILAPPGALVRIHAFGHTRVSILDARPWIHFINAGGDANIEIVNSRFVTGIGGSIQLDGNASLRAVDSQIGGIALRVPAGASLQADGLRPQTFSHFDLQKDLQPTGISYSLVLSNTTVVTDTLGEGPFERGWIVFAEDTASLELTNSFLHKLVLNMPAGGDDVTIDDLVLGQPTEFTLENIHLEDTTIVGQWGFFLHGGRHAEFNACKGLWLFLFDDASVRMNESTMNEFDPRQYRGLLSFRNSEWKMSGEIIDNNNFLMEGTVKMDDPDVRQSLSWSQSVVTRTFPILVLNAAGKPAPGTSVSLTRGSETVVAVTDAQGWARVSLRFDDANYKAPWSLRTGAGWPAVQVDFFTNTPIVVGSRRLFLPSVRRQ